MNIRSNLSFARPQAAALALAVSLLSLGATSANAQWFNWDDALPPIRVERMIQASGYRLTGPVMRNGEVYLANVLGREDDRERLVIDARDGRLLRRFAAAPRERFAGGDWSGPSRPQGFFDGLFDRQDDIPPARAPANVYGDADDGATRAPAPHAHAAQGGQVARADDSANPSSPTVILGPSAAPNIPVLEKPKSKPQAKHKKPELAPVAQPAAPPANVKPAPVAALPPASPPQAPSNPEAAITPNVATPSHTEAAHEPASAPATVAADAKANPMTPTPEPAPTVPPAAPKAVASKPALNDVPVAPLE